MKKKIEIMYISFICSDHMAERPICGNQKLTLSDASQSSLIIQKLIENVIKIFNF